jgi:hypothetical protein
VLQQLLCSCSVHTQSAVQFEYYLPQSNDRRMLVDNRGVGAELGSSVDYI